MLTLVDRYIGRRILMTMVTVGAVLFSMFFLMVLVDALRDYGKGEFGLRELLSYVLLSQPRRLYEVLPVVVLVGTLAGLSTLAVSSELVALRAAGMSKVRIVGAGLKAGVLVAVIAVLLGESIVPEAETRAQADRARALATGLQTRQGGIWIRDGESFLRIGDVLPDRSLIRINIYDVGAVPCADGSTTDCGARGLRTHIHAEHARLEAGRWRLSDVRLSRVSEQGVEMQQVAEQEWPSALTPEVLAAFAIRPEGLSLTNLTRYIGHLEQHGQDTGRYRLAFWQKLLMPATILVMIVLATPFVFQPLRSGALSQRIFIGVMLGLLFVLVNRSFGYFGLIYAVPPLLGALVPPLLFLALAVMLLRRNT